MTDTPESIATDVGRHELAAVLRICVAAKHISFLRVRGALLVEADDRVYTWPDAYPLERMRAFIDSARARRK